LAFASGRLPGFDDVGERMLVPQWRHPGKKRSKMTKMAEALQDPVALYVARELERGKGRFESAVNAACKKFRLSRYVVTQRVSVFRKFFGGMSFGGG
jgi:hypothetical protein